MSFHETLDSFLLATSSAGSIDSSGDFQVNVEVARERLRVFQEELSVFALLRLVQGLVACGARRIAVKLHRGRVELESDVRVSMDELHSSYRSHAGLTESALGMLAAGVNASLCESGVAVWVSTDDRRWDPRTDQTVSHSRAGFHFVQEFPSRPFRVANLFRRTNLFRELERRCRYCPCEFVLDGRRLKAQRPLYSPPMGDSSFSTGIPELEHVERGEGFRYHLPDMHFYQCEEEFWLWGSEAATPRSQADGQFFPAKGYTGLPKGFRQRNPRCKAVCLLYDPGDQQWCMIHFLRYGVLSEAHKHPDLPPNSVVLVDATDLSTDLSGLKIVRDHRFEERVRSVMQLTVRAVELLQEHHAAAEEAYEGKPKFAPWRRLPIFGEKAVSKSVARRLKIWSTWAEEVQAKLASDEPLSDSMRW